MASPNRLKGFGLSHQMLEQDIYDNQLLDDIGSNWKDLARALGYNQAAIEAIEKEKGNSFKECCIELHVRWLRREGRDATAGKLAEALIKIERKNLADDLIEGSILGPSHCRCDRCNQKTSVEAKALAESGDPNQNKKCEMSADELASILKEKVFKMSVRIKKLEDDLSVAKQKCQEAEQEVAQISKMSARITELEDELSSAMQKCQETEQENSRLLARIEELEEARQQKQEDITDTGSPDIEEASVVSTDTDESAREHHMRMKLEDLKQQLTTYVTSPLEVREVNQDQLDTPVKLDLLTRLSNSLQELYSETKGMVLETCKCGEDLKREFYDFAYHGLRGEHNDLVHRVKDLESTQGEMSEEEKKAFENLQGYQVNRQKLVEMLEKLWRGFFSPPERLPKTPRSAPVEGSEKSSDYKKVTRRTNPGARTKEKKTRDEATSSAAPSNSDHANYEVRLNIAKQRKSVRDMFIRTLQFRLPRGETPETFKRKTVPISLSTGDFLANLQLS